MLWFVFHVKYHCVTIWMLVKSNFLNKVTNSWDLFLINRSWVPPLSKYTLVSVSLFLADVDMLCIYREVKVCLPAPQILSKNLEQKFQTDKHFQLSEAFFVGRVHHKIDFVLQSTESALPYGNSSALMFRLCFIRALYSQTWSCSCLNMLDQNSVALVFKLLYVKHLDSTK